MNFRVIYLYFEFKIMLTLNWNSWLKFLKALNKLLRVRLGIIMKESRELTGVPAQF